MPRGVRTTKGGRSNWRRLEVISCTNQKEFYGERRMGQPVRIGCGQITSRSPSLRPSPAGRGRIISSLTQNRATGIAEQFPKFSETRDRCSLSQRERVRVRESATKVLMCYARFPASFKDTRSRARVAVLLHTGHTARKFLEHQNET